MNKIRRASVVLVLLLAACGQSSGQTVDDIGQWNGLFAQDHFTSDSRFRWWLDGHYRLFEDSDGFGQSIVRPGLGFDIGENSALWAGYAWIRTSPISGDDVDEHRIWQQWTSSRSAGPLKFAARTRLEQRFFESTDDTGLRLRQFLRVEKNLGACSKRTFIVWDELFVALNDTDFGQRGGLDQNRVFVGFGFKKNHSSPWIVEVGYMNQAINQRGPVDRSNHILAVNIFRSPKK